MLKSINPKQDDLAGVGPGVKDVSDTVLVDLQFEILAHRPCIEKVMRPIRPAEIHLMKGSCVRSHQAPLKAIRRDVKREMCWIDILHDGACVPPRAVPVRLAFKRISSHFQVGTVGVEHTNTFIGGDGDGAIHQVGGIG